MPYRSRVLCSRKRLLQRATGAATVGGTGELLVTVGSGQQSRVSPHSASINYEWNRPGFGSRAVVVNTRDPAFPRVSRISRILGANTKLLDSSNDEEIHITTYELLLILSSSFYSFFFFLPSVLLSLSFFCLK